MAAKLPTTTSKISSFRLLLFFNLFFITISVIQAAGVATTSGSSPFTTVMSRDDSKSNGTFASDTGIRELSISKKVEIRKKKDSKREMIGSVAPACTFNECRGCKYKCSAEQVPVEGNDPMNSPYHYKCVCHR